MSVHAPRTTAHSVHTATLADVLERILDKGLVIAGDIKVKLVDIELLTIQVRLVVASVEKAKEMGIDWWCSNPEFRALTSPAEQEELSLLRDRVAELERQLEVPRTETPTTSPTETL